MTRAGRSKSEATAKACCQVCGVDLACIKAKEYCHKKRVCPQHLQADSVELIGQDCLHRFCHQCGKFEPLTQFDGIRRSCRDRLVLRRKTAHRTTDADSMSDDNVAPCSSSALQSQVQTAAGTAAMAAGSLDFSQEHTAADTAACSMFEGTSGWDVGLQLDQGWHADLASCTATPAAPNAAFDLPGQQQDGVGMPIGSSYVAQGPAALADPSFDDLLAAVMEQELQECLLEQQQQWPQQQQQWPQSNSSGPSGPSMMPDLAAAAPAMPTPLSPGCISNALHNPAVAAGAINHSPVMGVTHLAAVGSPSDTCSHNGVLREVDMHAGRATHGTAQHSVQAAEAAASRRRHLLHQVQDLLQEEKMLRQTVAAAATTGGQHVATLHPASHVLHGPVVPGRTAMPAQHPAAASAPWAQPGDGGCFVSFLAQPPDVFSMPSNASSASLAVMPGDSINAGGVLSGTNQLQLQHQSAAAAMFAHQQHELLVAERMQDLQTQFTQVATQLNQLRCIIGNFAAGPAANMPAAPAISFCPGSYVGPVHLQ